MSHDDKAPDWDKVNLMVGFPDYGVAFCVAPWPDGGWHAGLFVTSREWVLEQIDRDDGTMTPAMATVPGQDDTWPHWDTFDGFIDERGNRVGLRAHGVNAAEAVDELWALVHKGSPNS